MYTRVFHKILLGHMPENLHNMVESWHKLHDNVKSYSNCNSVMGFVTPAHVNIALTITSRAVYKVTKENRYYAAQR